MNSSVEFILALGVAAVLQPALAMDCPSIPPTPTSSEADLAFRNAWQVVAPPYSVRDTVRSDEQAPYGIGYLQVQEAENHSGSTHEGWVKWRDAEVGPWVRVYTQGC